MKKVGSTFQIPPSTKVTRYKLCGTMSLITDLPLILTSTAGKELGYSGTPSFT
jgi:hypothetical protein